MKVFAISDLHLSTVQPKPMDIFGGNWDNHWQKVQDDWQSRVSADDLVLIPGDISWAMQLTDALADLEQIGALNGKKVILRGNHDYWWSGIGKVRNVLPSGMYALQNDSMRFGDIIVCGSRGWTCPGSSVFTEKDDRKIYEREILRLEMSLKAAIAGKKDGDKVVCMMHYPPFNSDRADSGFTKLIVAYGLDAVVYGHLHGKDARADMVLDKFGTKFFLTSTDLTGHKLVEIF